MEDTGEREGWDEQTVPLEPTDEDPNPPEALTVPWYVLYVAQLCFFRGLSGDRSSASMLASLEFTTYGEEQDRGPNKPPLADPWAGPEPGDPKPLPGDPPDLPNSPTNGGPKPPSPPSDPGNTGLMIFAETHSDYDHTFIITSMENDMHEFLGGTWRFVKIWDPAGHVDQALMKTDGSEMILSGDPTALQHVGYPTGVVSISGGLAIR